MPLLFVRYVPKVVDTMGMKRKWARIFALMQLSFQWREPNSKRNRHRNGRVDEEAAQPVAEAVKWAGWNFEQYEVHAFPLRKAN